MFTLSQLGNRVGIIQSSYNDNHVYLRNENCNYKVKLSLDGFLVNLFVSWQEFNIDGLHKQFAIALAGLISDPVSKKICYQCSAFEDNLDIWNLRGTGLVDFSNLS